MINFKNQRKNIKIFFIILKKIQTILKKYKNFNDFNSFKINQVLKNTTKKLFKKVFDFLYKFKKNFDSKQILIFFSHKINNYKIELIANVFVFFKNKVYFLFFKKFETLKIYFKKNLTKEFINFNKVFFVFSIFFAIKLNEKFRLCVNYRKLNVIIKRNNYFISLIEKILI